MTSEKQPPYTPFEGCPHTWCVGCGTCHECEAENPPSLIGPDRESALKGGAIPKRHLRAPASTSGGAA